MHPILAARYAQFAPRLSDAAADALSDEMRRAYRELALTAPPSVDRHSSAAFDAAFAARAVPTRRDYAVEPRFADRSPVCAEVHAVNVQHAIAGREVSR